MNPRRALDLATGEAAVGLGLFPVFMKRLVRPSADLKSAQSHKLAADKRVFEGPSVRFGVLASPESTLRQ